MAKAEAMLISAPIGARHVGGVDVSSTAQPSMLHSYFHNTTLEPDEVPSHTFVAQGNVEVPRRSDTIAHTIRRPSVSLRRSLSRLRTSSISHITDLHRKVETEEHSNMSVARSDSARTARPLRIQSSMSRLRQKVGLDRDIHVKETTPKPSTPDSDVMPKPIQEHHPSLSPARSISRLTLQSASGTPVPNVPASVGVMSRPHPIATNKELPSLDREKRSKVERKTAQSQHTVARRPTRPKRADSGTAIDLDDVPVNERPLGFKEIRAVRNFDHRMRHYQRAREYWAHADHGLVEWAESASGSRKRR
ncbi:hypothetical protein EK21DRAFT_64004 [Setomelanomma holmii]|uniref:Uncharacterized protein n=1 Tax=Setomelanomma holmii TaxID=210430 RepID=A0A9P4HCD8_9PLEO|nr:hypothetical protein EK21DRAFT_64004 [Setomelanomma holmii]